MPLQDFELPLWRSRFEQLFAQAVGCWSPECIERDTEILQLACGAWEERESAACLEAHSDKCQGTCCAQDDRRRARPGCNSAERGRLIEIDDEIHAPRRQDPFGGVRLHIALREPEEVHEVGQRAQGNEVDLTHVLSIRTW